MRCGRITVEGEPEEIAVSRRPRYWQRHGKRSNPYSTSGLDKFESVYAELSARREYIAKNTGEPEALVKFAYSKNGWVPVVVRARDGIEKKNGAASAAGVSILGPVEKNNGEKDGKLRRKDAANDTDGESENISISVLDERSHSFVFKTTAFGVLGLTAMWVRRLAVPAAAAMAVVMAINSVMCMKKFILTGVLYLATLFRNLKISKHGEVIEEIAEQKEIDKFSRRTPRPGRAVSAPSSPLRPHVHPTEFSSMASPRAVKPKIMDREENRLHHQSKAKKFRRVVSMDNRPNRATRLQGSDSFYRRRGLTAMTYSANVNTAAMIITLFCLVFYGRLCAIFFTCAWWYLLPMLGEHSERMRVMNRNNDSRMVDLQASQYMKKAIVGGLLGRKRN